MLKIFRADLCVNDKLLNLNIELPKVVDTKSCWRYNANARLRQSKMWETVIYDTTISCAFLAFLPIFLNKFIISNERKNLGIGGFIMRGIKVQSVDQLG